MSKAAGGFANSVEPDQTPRYAASDLGLHCLLRHVYTVCLDMSVQTLRVNKNYSLKAMILFIATANDLNSPQWEIERAQKNLTCTFYETICSYLFEFVFFNVDYIKMY